MATTESQSAQVVGVNMAVGRYIIESGDTAAAITITVGFKARYVKVVNLNASGDVMIEWFEGMAADEGVKTAIDGTRSLITSLGITVSDKSFVIGLDTDLNVKAEQLSWLAIA